MKKDYIIVLLILFVLSGCTKKEEIATFEVKYEQTQYQSKITPAEIFTYAITETDTTSLKNGDHVTQGDIIYTSYSKEISLQREQAIRSLEYAKTDIEETKTKIEQCEIEIKNIEDKIDLIDKNSVLYEEQIATFTSELESLSAKKEALLEQKNTYERQKSDQINLLSTLVPSTSVKAKKTGFISVSQNEIKLYSDDVLVKIESDSNTFPSLRDAKKISINYNDVKYFLKFSYYLPADLPESNSKTTYSVFFFIDDFDQDPLINEDIVTTFESDNIYIPSEYVFIDDKKLYVNLNGKKKYITGNKENSRFKVDSGLKKGDLIIKKDIIEESND